MLIYIDPGHAISTPGKRSIDESLREYEFNRSVAKKLANILQRHGITTMFSCDLENKIDATLKDRVTRANNAHADLFISIHANAFGTDWNEANGVEVFHKKGSIEGSKLATSIYEELKKLGLKQRGVKTDNLYVTKYTNMPAVLIEHEFMTNKTSVEKLKSDAWRERFAIADAVGILKYLGIPWRDEEKMTKEDAIKIVKDKAKLNDTTMEYLTDDFRWGDSLIIKLAQAMIK